MSVVIDTSNRKYIDYTKVFFASGRGMHNGAYYYSKEIAENIIPNVNVRLDIAHHEQRGTIFRLNPTSKKVN